MVSNKYPILDEFFPYNRFAIPANIKLIQFFNRFLKPPRFLWEDPELEIKQYSIPGYEAGKIRVIIIRPLGLEDPAPCLLYYHGGGFIIEASPMHFRHAVSYAKQSGCVVAFPLYRLAPEYPYPYPQEDCYAAFKWLAVHATKLGIDPERIGVGGDSAGGLLSAVVTLMARDRKAKCQPCLQLLIYPYLDGRNNSESYQRFTDTPMWNSDMSKKVRPLFDPDPDAITLAYRSPVEAESLHGLPPTYIEIAEFDSLHDDGILYHMLLKEEGVETELHEIKGAMHGFDMKLSAPTTQKVVARRAAFLNNIWKI